MELEGTTRINAELAEAKNAALISFKPKTGNNKRTMELDYADEITYNAQIAVNKYKWFKRALYIDLCGILILVIVT